MFKRRTLFIVGAGASAEVKFDIGWQLAQKIADNMRPARGERRHEATIKDDFLLDEFRRRVGHDKGYQDFMEAARRIHEGIELTHSVDDFLNVHQQDPLIVEIGKAAIIRAVLQAEKDCTMYVDHSNAFNRLSFRDIADTWFVKLMRVLAPGSGPQAAADAFHNVTFIVFNYDRCLEHFLEYAISSLYGIDRMRARQMVSQFRIIHPYGTIGDLDSLPFGGERGKDYAVLPRVERIRTYAEQFADKTELMMMRNEVVTAGCIVFLGFSYLEQNMKLLEPPAKMKWKPIFGTAWKMSDHSVNVVAEDILSMFDPSMIDSNSIVELNNKLKCAELFDH